MIGNDIVDYQFDKKKYLNHRWLQRILTPLEQQHVLTATRPNRYLWSLWAAKEASYKALQRINPSLTFSPSAYALSVSSLNNLHHNEQKLSAAIDFENHRLSLRFYWPKETVVHCLACHNPENWIHLHSLFEHRPHLSGYQQQSLAVRELAQTLLKKHHIHADIIRPNQSMPGYSKPGAPILVDPQTGHTWPHIISLSHDHEYIGVALYCL
ncbi:4'-phosphopantetheinyl transferase [Marinicella pacifica]|uniref:4'-phosphopantetheinyl transferase n=1 Tax=Marinicella pacifica TaxID=1171543 RepID=A0A917FS29_9GAMM|nr:4'-phosphopantetheinyl transferase superfamily protein [Marinicella pacifica]GGG03024.1 4'-phosphopantetheinyl transferase [Marinicella pacifica]